MQIGLRIPGTARELPFDEFCRWCVDNGFDAVDISSVTPEIVGQQETPDWQLAPQTCRAPATC